MKFLFKIEDALNSAILWIGSYLNKGWVKVRPAWFMRFVAWWTVQKSKLQSIPALCRDFVAKNKEAPKNILKVDYKGIFSQAIEAGKKAYSQNKKDSPIKAVLSALAIPFNFIFKWAKSLSPGQFLLLFSSTLASIMAILGITINSYRLVEKSSQMSRSPASIEVENLYDRPGYYKKETREVSFTNVKLPVFVMGITELQSLMIDFSVNTSNRATRQWLEKHEFQVRDHLVLTVEPLLPAYPMTDEGRVVLTEKLKHEINTFLKTREVEGEVKEVRIIYILAN